MELIAKASGGADRPLPEAGMQHGILYSIIVLGTQEVEYMQTKKVQFKFNVGWELPHLPKLEYEDDGKKIMRPQCIFKSYTRSLYEKANLAQDLAGWRGQGFSKDEQNGFDVFKMLVPGVNALLNIVHYENKNGDMKAKYTSISKLMAGMAETLPENTIVEYEPSMTDNFPEGMPDWAREAAAKSPEYKGIEHGKEVFGDDGPPPTESDVPAYDDSEIPY